MSRASAITAPSGAEEPGEVRPSPPRLHNEPRSRGVFHGHIAPVEHVRDGIGDQVIERQHDEEELAGVQQQQGPFHAELPTHFARRAVAVAGLHLAEAVAQALGADVVDIVPVAHMLLDEGALAFAMHVAAPLVAGGADDEHAARLETGAVTAQCAFVLQDVLHHVHAHHQFVGAGSNMGGHVIHAEGHPGTTDALEEGVAIGHLLLLHIHGGDAPVGR